MNSLDGWFLTDPSAAGAGTQVFCFTHAGGNSRSFLRWQPLLGKAAQLVAVVAPGRGHRAGTAPVRSVDEFADGAAAAIEASLSRPTVLLGHSLGALVAFEVARRLRSVPSVAHLVASGCAAPKMLPSDRVVAAARLEGRDFARAVGFFGGLPPEVVAAEDLYDVLLPPLQADFRMVAGYRYRPAAPLEVGLHLVNGVDDPHVGSDVLAGWAGECQTEPTRHDAIGGHFYFEEHPETLIDLLLSLALSAEVDPSDDAHHVEYI
jgi:surfactin synthase thioesterase subunit